MKMTLFSQPRRDARGFLTYVHSKTTWRENGRSVKDEHDPGGEREKAVKLADGKENKELFITLNFRKQYVKSKKLIQTETLEIQTAPEIKKSINTAIFKAAKNDQLPGIYFPGRISNHRK